MRFCFHFLFLLYFSVSAEHTLDIDEKKAIEYADFLFQEKEYYRAITEYKKFLFFYPQSHQTEYASIQIGKSYMAGGNIEEALKYWSTLSIENFRDEKKLQILLFHSVAWFDLDAQRIFHYRKENIEKGVALLHGISQRYPQANFYANFEKEWREKRQVLTQKSPITAGVLSALIPGSGSAYVGRYQEMVYTFFFTSLFYWATLDAQNADNNSATYFFGFITGAFYLGNIYTAVNSTYKFNDQQQDQLLQILRRKYRLYYIP